MEKPSHPYSQHDAAWARYVHYLARWQLLQTRDIAGACGVNIATFKKHENILSVMRSGWAEARGSVALELMMVAAADPMMFDDPIERSQVRTHKLDALKTLHKTFEKRDELSTMSNEREADRVILKEMSLEDLKARAAELLK